MCPVRSVTYVASRSSPIYTRRFSLSPFGEYLPKNQFANYLPALGTAKYLNRERSATVTGSGCTSLNPEWGEDYPRTRVCRGTSADAGSQMCVQLDGRSKSHRTILRFVTGRLTTGAGLLENEQHRRIVGNSEVGPKRGSGKCVGHGCCA